MTPDVASAILNVDLHAGSEQIVAAYKLRARMTHPDRFAGSPPGVIKAAHTEFIRVTEARDVLLAASQSGSRPAPPPPTAPQPAPQPRASPSPEKEKEPTHPDPEPAYAASPQFQQKESGGLAGYLGVTSRVLLLVVGLLVLGGIAILVVVSGLPRLGASDSFQGVDAPRLTNIEWSGTDSDGDLTSFVFNDDGTVDFSLGEDEYADPADTWSLDTDNHLTIDILFSDGTYTYEGVYDDSMNTIDLAGSSDEATDRKSVV